MPLVVAFWTGWGVGRGQTTYRSLAGFSAEFPREHGPRKTSQAKAPAPGGTPAASPEIERIAELIPRCATLEQRQAILAEFLKSREAMARKLTKGRKRPRRKITKKSTAPKAPKAAAATDKQRPAELATSPAALAPSAAPEEERISLETARSKYESDLSRFLLRKESWSEGITLRLGGISRWEKRYILKVAVTNGTSADFFIREFAVRTAEERRSALAFFQHFVEPGRTEEGYLVFPKPETGAKPKIVLKEDGQRGREIAAPIDYPF